MELTRSFIPVLQNFVCVFTAPTYVTFVAVVTGWILSHRHRYLTEVIFSSGNVGKGHWCRFHRFFSHAAWDLDALSLHLAKLISTILAPGATLSWAVDDTLCRKRGLTLYGAGMHYDPLISSRSKRLVSWGHDWVVLCLIVANPFWAPTKVFALPVAMRLYRNRQGLTKGKKSRGKLSKAKCDPKHRTRPELALKLIQLVAQWFPDEEIMISGDSAYGGKSVLSHLPPNAHLISHVHPDGALYEPAPPKREGTKGRNRKKGKRLPKLIIYSLVIVWFHQAGHRAVRFPFSPWYPKKQEPSFADILTTLRRVSYEDKIERLLPKRSRLKTCIAQLTELLSRAG